MEIGLGSGFGLGLGVAQGGWGFTIFISNGLEMRNMRGKKKTKCTGLRHSDFSILVRTATGTKTKRIRNRTIAFISVWKGGI